MLGCVMLFATKGVSHYSPDKKGTPYGGYEPGLNHYAAVEILQTGRTTMTYHPTGYAYLSGSLVVSALLPHLPLSMLAVQIASLPLAVWGVGRIARQFGGSNCRAWGEWGAGLYYPFGYCAATFSNVYMTFLFATLSFAAFLPLLGGDETANRSEGRAPGRSLGRSLLVGLLLGLAACLRPNFGLFGVVFALALWRSTRSLWEAIIRSLPIAAVSLALLLTMTALNPPEPGQFARGSQAMNRSLLEATYQYSHQWWDWTWYEDESDPGFHDYLDHIHRIEAETGKPKTDPASQAAIGREAWKRILGMPGNTLKKILISSVRIWILIPTQLNSMPVEVAIAVQEFVLLGLTLAGLVGLWGKRGVFLLAAGVMLVTTVQHWFLHVEPRYAMPARGIELALAAIATAGIWNRWRGRNISRNSQQQASDRFA